VIITLGSNHTSCHLSCAQARENSVARVFSKLRERNRLLLVATGQSVCLNFVFNNIMVCFLQDFRLAVMSCIFARWQRAATRHILSSPSSQPATTVCRSALPPSPSSPSVPSISPPPLRSLMLSSSATSGIGPLGHLSAPPAGPCGPPPSIGPLVGQAVGCVGDALTEAGRKKARDAIVCPVWISQCSNNHFSLPFLLGAMWRCAGSAFESARLFEPPSPDGYPQPGFAYASSEVWHLALFFDNDLLWAFPAIRLLRLVQRQYTARMALLRWHWYARGRSPAFRSAPSCDIPVSCALANCMLGPRVALQFCVSGPLPHGACWPSSRPPCQNCPRCHGRPPGKVAVVSRPMEVELPVQILQCSRARKVNLHRIASNQPRQRRLHSRRSLWQVSLPRVTSHRLRRSSPSPRILGPTGTKSASHNNKEQGRARTTGLHRCLSRRRHCRSAPSHLPRPPWLSPRPVQ